MSATTLLTVEQVPIDQLRPDPANPRRIGDEELDSLERSIRQFGFVQPVLARKEDNTVIGGHQRLPAARRLGLASVPVTYLDVSIEQARLLNLALIKIGGSWDEQLLARLLADLQASPAIDLTLSGFAEDEIADLLRSLETQFTDPPYNVSLGDHGGQQRGARKRRIANDSRRRGRLSRSATSMAMPRSSPTWWEPGRSRSTAQR
jgi:hypothetical protein